MIIDIAFDPGKTTGYAVRIVGLRREDFIVGQCSTGSEVSDLLAVYEPLKIIYERFIPRAKAQDPVGLQVIGVIEDYAAKNHIEVIKQQPSVAKFFWTNDKLKKIGLYERGKPHAMDALRHLLYELSKHERKYIRALIED